MNFVVSLPTRAGAAGDVARRLARFVGPGLSARDASRTAALYLAIGTTLATTRAYTGASLTEVVGHLAVDTLPGWERSLGMLTGEGDTPANRQRAVTARWRAIHAGPSLAELTTTVRALEPAAAVLEVAFVDVYPHAPAATQRIVVLLPDATEDNATMRSRLAAALAVQVPGHVTWSLARGDGPDIDAFTCDSVDSVCDRDVLQL